MTRSHERSDIEGACDDGLRRDTPFPDTGTPLREDVRTLGKDVGWVLQEQGGEALFQDVEAARTASLERPTEATRRTVLLEARDEGLFGTVHRAPERLDEPLALGCSSAGTVLACGVGVGGLRPGDRPAKNGPHAEVVRVPRRLRRCPSSTPPVTVSKTKALM